MLSNRSILHGWKPVCWRLGLCAALLGCAGAGRAAPQPCLRLDLTQAYPGYNLTGGTQVLFSTAQGTLAMILGGGGALESADQGATWHNWAGFNTWPQPQATGQGYMDVVRRGNELLAFTTYSFYGGICLWRSSDEGRTWTGGDRITHNAGLWQPAMTNEKVVQSETGRLVVPFELPLGSNTPPANPDNVGTLYSDDGGQSWAQSPLFGPPNGYPAAPEGFSEPSVAELANGKQWMVIRALGGTLWQSFSTDGGVSWGPPSSTGLVSPLSSVCAKRIPGSDAVIAIWDNATPAAGGSSFGSYWGPRSPMVFAISRDNCETWSQPVTIASGAAAYPSAYFSEGKMFLSYWENTDPNGNIWAADSHLKFVAYDVQSLLEVPEPNMLVLVLAGAIGLFFYSGRKGR